jgi:hypothetical protein
MSRVRDGLSGILTLALFQVCRDMTGSSKDSDVRPSH